MEVLNFYHIGLEIPEGAVYIGRSMRGLTGHKLANPFKLDKGGGNRDEVVDKYRSWLWGQIRDGKVTVDDLLSLDGKDLVCFCHPKRCHGDILISAVEWAKKQKEIPCLK